MPHSIETKTARARLAISRKAVFVRLDVPGVSLGYRRTKGAGSWVLRMADGQRSSFERRIATADDVSPANGKDVLTFSQAAEACRRLARGEDADVKPGAVATLADALAAYNGRADNVTRIKHHLTPTLLRRPVMLLSVEELQRWRDAMARRMAPASVNRTIAIAKAILNAHADRDDTITSRRAWEIGLKPLPEATVARNVVVEEAGIRALIREARAIGPELGLLIEALALTGARVSQLARCQCRDLVGHGDGARLMVPSSAKGLRKRASRTPVPIPVDLADRLRTAFAGRAVDAPLLVKPSGDEWRRSDHFRLFNRAREAASLPRDVTIYSLRHSHITAQLLAGLPVQLVSRLHDTSASQIEKHYAAEIASFGDAQVRAVMMKVEQPSADILLLRQGMQGA